MTIAVVYGCALTAEEVLAVGVPAALPANRVLIHDQFNTRSAQIPDVEKVAYFEAALTAGAGSIDLTDLTHVNNLAVNGSGLEVAGFRIKAKANNSGPITIEPADSNGFDVFMVILNPGGEFTLANNFDAVGASDRLLDLTGTGSDAIEVSVIFTSP